MVKASIDWRLSSGIASQANLALLLAVLFSFPLVLRWTGALSVQYVDPRSPEHTHAFVKFCLVISAFLWGCFLIAYAGIRRCGRITPRALIGSNWSRWRTIVGDLGIALATLAALAIIGNLFNSFSGT
ncbi:MAG: hypothetical protein M3Z23_05500, partial [Acidobacteriota bacterium]|nr:hypothetical protein [Acidobacteriota bacterium]